MCIFRDSVPSFFRSDILSQIHTLHIHAQDEARDLEGEEGIVSDEVGDQEDAEKYASNALDAPAGEGLAVENAEEMNVSKEDVKGASRELEDIMDVGEQAMKEVGTAPGEPLKTRSGAEVVGEGQM